ncbi:MAG: hypothetical protein U1C46_06005 [Bacteroidales bacterium]|nr:hypothetical protein [Bacteroidales bacterium]MDZ4204353.1 hypothetical protein [Bacteroidales bacterium]
MKKCVAMLIVLFCLVSCQNQTCDNKGSDNNTSEVTSEASKETSKSRYAIKSGIVEYKTEIMGMATKQTLTFDDYGKKEATDVEMEMMGTKIHTVTITRDGFIYTLDMHKKTGTKINGNSPNIDFENLSEQIVNDMNLKKEGKEEFLGKTCEKISIDYTKMKMKGTFLVYKGVALKVDTDMGTMKMKLVADKFVENPEIPAEKFEIPADITITVN